jgi:flavin reductase (DIM6/NTAB) family NADH-FMN oxidoreductase RutF
MMAGFEPPTVGHIISNRDYTVGILKATKECESTFRQWNWREVAACRHCSGREVDKFSAFWLTRASPSRNKPRTIHHLGGETFRWRARR